MSIPVDPGDLAEAAQPYGRTAYVVVSGTKGPRITHVQTQFRDGELIVMVGAGSGAAAEDAGAITLLWPAIPAQSMSLIADCTVVRVELIEGGARVFAAPTHAVRHRPAPAQPDVG